MAKNTKQPKTSFSEVKDLKPTVISLIHKIEKFPAKSKKSILHMLGQKNVSISNTRKGRNEIYEFIATLFTHHPQLRIPENKEILKDFSKKLEAEQETPAPSKKFGSGAPQ